MIISDVNMNHSAIFHNSSQAVASDQPATPRCAERRSIVCWHYSTFSGCFIIAPRRCSAVADRYIVVVLMSA